MKLLITCGGTEGHIYPAIAIAQKTINKFEDIIPYEEWDELPNIIFIWNIKKRRYKYSFFEMKIILI